MKGVQIKDKRERKKAFSFSFLFRRHSNNIKAKKENKKIKKINK